MGTRGLVSSKGRPRFGLPESSGAAGARPARARVAPPSPPPRSAFSRPRRALTPRRQPRAPGGGRPGGGVVASPPGSARANARLVYRPQAWPPPPRRPARPPSPERRAYPEQPRAGGSLDQPGRRRRRQRPGSGVPRRQQSGPGEGGEEPGWVRAPSSRSPRGSDHPGVGAGGRERGPREAEEAPRTHRLPPHLPGPPSPRPSHPIPSCGPGRRGDHGVLAPARAPAPRAAASSAAPRTRALDGAAPPPAGPRPAPPAPPPGSCGAAPRLEGPGCGRAGTAARAGEGLR